MTDRDSVPAPKGRATAEIARDFFGLQLHYADVFSARAGIPLVEAITFHTNFHRLFAYGNLGKQPADPAFLSLAQAIAAMRDPAARLDHLITAYADRPADPWPVERFPFGDHFACEAPSEDGIVRIHFRNRFNTSGAGPLDMSNVPQRRADLTAMFGFVANRWPDAKAVKGTSWLYNMDSYCRLFPPAYGASRTVLTGPRSMHGLSTWGQFLDYRGYAKPKIVSAFTQNLATLDPAQPWLSFPYQVLVTQAPFDAFREEYDL